MSTYKKEVGYKALKSGPLAPTSSKLTSQYMVLDQMNNYWTKIRKAKPAIDNSVPKSMQTSQRARDTVMRSGKGVPGHTLYKQKTVPRTETRVTTYSQEFLDDLEFDDPEINSIIQETLLGTAPTDTNGVSNKATYHSSRTSNGAVRADIVRRELMQHQHRQEQLTQPSFVRASSTNALNGSHVMRGTQRQSSADILDHHKHKFKQTEKPFTPRTLIRKNNVKSRLSSSKCYTAPRRQKAHTTEKEDRPKPTPRHKHVDDTINSVTMETEGMTLMSRDGSRVDRLNKPSVVPRLDITQDRDNAVWLKEQANKAQLRKNLVNAQESGSPRKVSRSSLSRTIDEEDEESKYIEFMNDVLTDVNNRGIVTNRVLKRVFEQHVERRRKELDVRKMRSCLQKLREQLGITGADHVADNEQLADGSTLHETGFEFDSYTPGKRRSRLDSNTSLTMVTEGASTATFGEQRSATPQTPPRNGHRSATPQTPPRDEYRSATPNDTLTSVTGEIDTLRFAPKSQGQNLEDTMDSVDAAGVMRGMQEVLDDRSEASVASSSANIGRHEINKTTPLQMTLSPQMLKTQLMGTKANGSVPSSHKASSRASSSIDSYGSPAPSSNPSYRRRQLPPPQAAFSDSDTEIVPPTPRTRQPVDKSLNYSEDFEDETFQQETLDRGDTLREADTIRTETGNFSDTMFGEDTMKHNLGAINGQQKSTQFDSDDDF